ncbi:MAG TPA: M48 family metallopeptidase [Thermoanaerobaculia bacterium]|nr:M48 family metallopeptidase [Thermoanaerobaculia bacterium]HXT50679.1 M48 family metallopeptidase [Thermoanaerobaculia bacterium]
MDANLRRRAVPLALALLLAPLLGCASSGVNKGQFNLISIEEEWQLGNQLAADLARKLRLVDDSVAQEYVESVGRRVVAQTEMGNLPWHFHIVADPEVNAFTIPGGHVYVNTGLIEKSPNVAAFTGALAHEISHVVARHSTEQLSKAYGIEAIGGAVLGKNPAVYEQILASVLAQGAMARFSREAEREADRLGAAYMFKAGYDPQGMVQMFETLLAERQRQPGSVERFFASHPLTEERIREVQKEIAGFPSTANLIASDPRFDQLQDRLSG